MDLLFKTYLEGSKHNIEYLLFESFLITKKDLDPASELEVSINIEQNYIYENEINSSENMTTNIIYYIQNLNIKLLMVIPVTSALIGSLRNIFAFFLKNTFEINKQSDRQNPLLSIIKFSCWIIFMPSIVTLSLLKNVIDLPNKAILYGFNNTPTIPHKPTAFVLSLAISLGLYHKLLDKKQNNNDLSAPTFIFLLSTSTIQIMSLITAILYYAKPKNIISSDVFKNHFIQNNGYNDIDKNSDNIDDIEQKNNKYDIQYDNQDYIINNI